MSSTRRRTTQGRLPITPPATSPVASESDMSVDSSEGSQNSGRVCPLNRYMAENNPNYNPLSEEFLKGCLRAMYGNANIDMEQVWGSYVTKAEEVLEEVLQRPMVKKPEKGDTSIMYYDIPDSDNLAIRLWDANMGCYGLYCFDLYNKSKGMAINLPEGYGIFNAPHAGAFVVGGFGSPVKSMEISAGIKPHEIRAGEERFGVPEGSHLALIRPQKQPFYFAIPIRQYYQNGEPITYAQPRC